MPFIPDTDLTSQFNRQNDFLNNFKNNYDSGKIRNKQNYILEQTDQMIYLNFYLFVIYYIVLSVFITFFYFSTSFVSSQYLRIFIILLLLLLPFIIVRIEKFIYTWLIYTRDFFYSNIYLSKDY